MGSDPDGQIWGQLILIVLLTLINAGFAAAEIAVVSSSRARMQAQADKGDRKAAKLVAIMKDSSHFLATICTRSGSDFSDVDFVVFLACFRGTLS